MKLKTCLTSIQVLLLCGLVRTDEEFCPITGSREDALCGSGTFISDKSKPAPSIRYLLYDVNPPEGFNLRRDVYIRIATFTRNLKSKANWQLVLPPWGQVYHWQSPNVGSQTQLQWKMFFDVASLQRFAPVIEMSDYLTNLPKNEATIQEVYILQHYEDMWEEGREWKDQWTIAPCLNKMPYTNIDNTYTGPFWGYKNITAKKVSCASFQGHMSLLKDILEESNATSVMIDHAEVALHDVYGDRYYWEARRSMRFASKLIELASDFREKYLNSTDASDGTVKPSNWQDEKEKKNAKGGPYMAVHLRRRDFLWGRSKEVPNLQFAAKQLDTLLTRYRLQSIFVATDAPKSEFVELKSYLYKFKVYRFDPSPSLKYQIKDGGTAIVDQIICSHARFFIGTHESTFSYRIQEEREIMGFNEETTFNRLCGNEETEPCSQPTRWKVVF